MPEQEEKKYSHRELLEKFTTYLLERGFVDDDIWVEGDVVKEFLAEMKLKYE